MRILVILGHPRTDSFGAALAAAFVRGTQAAGAAVRRITVSQLRFDPEVRTRDPRDQELEADLLSARESIRWADHLVFVYPTFWGGMPAGLKGFVDRVFTAGFAFRYTRDGGGRLKLLRGKTAEIVTTIDMPPEAYRARYRQPGVEALRRATLRFCGVQTTRVSLIGPVGGSSAETRAGWLQEQYQAGERRAHGARTPLQRTAAVAARAAVRHRVTLYLALVAAFPLVQQVARLLTAAARELPPLWMQFAETPAALFGWAPALILAAELQPSESAVPGRISERRYKAALVTAAAALLWVVGLQLFVYDLQRQVWLLILMLAAGRSLFNALAFRLPRQEPRQEPERAVGIAAVFGVTCVLPPFLAQLML